MQRALTLNLISPIYYFPVSLSLGEAVSSADKKAIGYDAVIEFAYSFKDEKLSISTIGSGERDGYTEEERKIIEAGGSIKRKDGESVEIPSGKYLFEQLPFIPEENEIPRIILPYLKDREGRFYIRIYKENILECVLQLLFPSP